MQKWIFADWKLPNQSDIELIQDLGFTDVVLGLALPRKPKFTPLYGRKRTERVIAKVKDLGLNVHLMSWVYSYRLYMSDCLRYFSRLAEDTGAASILLDAEKDWHTDRDVTPIIMDLSCKSFDVGVTGLSFLHKSVRPLLDACDYCIPQAYSIWKPGKADHWSHGSSTKPYYQQKRSVDDWSVGKPIILGLSNYWARRPIRVSSTGDALPVMDTETSLTISICGALESDVQGIAYWSLKWFKGRGKNRAIAREVFKKYFPNEDI